MAHWMVENSIWIGIGVSLFLIGSKIVIGRFLKRLMDNTEEKAGASE